MRNILVCAVILFVTSSAWAKPPGVVLSAERVWGISHSTLSTEGGSSQSITSVAIGGSPLGQGGVYSAPRFGVDYVTSANVSVGGAVGIQNCKRCAFYDTDDSITSIMLAPRIGYFTMAGSRFGVWPRGGISYWSISVGDTDLSYTALTVEAPLVWFVVDTVGVFVTPHVDVGISGGTTDLDSKLTEIGAHFGVAAFL